MGSCCEALRGDFHAAPTCLSVSTWALGIPRDVHHAADLREAQAVRREGPRLVRYEVS